jgi:uncharacterized protein YqgV (UPF0045/DUF77 family)
MEKCDYPWRGCGATREITGCRFSISAMSDDFVSMILGSIKNVDTKKVWTTTDALSTIYRGKRIHVLDCVKSCFANVNDGKTHITTEATFSKGCPGDTDDECYLSEDDILLNKSSKKFEVLSKIAFYPLGITNYMDHIAYVVRLAMEKGLYQESSHYATMLKGDINDLFDYFNLALEYAEKNISHYVLQATLSVNSPTKKDV